MAIPFVVPEILGGWTPPDAIKLSEKAYAINRYEVNRFIFDNNAAKSIISCMTFLYTIDEFFINKDRGIEELSKLIGPPWDRL